MAHVNRTCSDVKDIVGFPNIMFTLVAQVGGDIIPEGSTFQGWPAEMLFRQQPKTDAKPESSDVCIDISADGLKPATQD